MKRWVLILLFALTPVVCAPKRVLYVTHSAGYRHGSIPVSVEVVERLGRASVDYEVVATEDLSRISAEALKGFDALFFYTSGELALSDGQKRAMLAFVRGGGGFGGVHSAADTLYTWPEYGRLIGAYFDGHPWVQRVRMNVEDPDHPATAKLPPSFEMVEEIYQFRDFSRDNVRVLLRLDTDSVDLKAAGVHRTDGDFGLAWRRTYGSGRVFYTALGHFDDTWRDERFQAMLDGALRWLTGAGKKEGRRQKAEESAKPAGPG